MKEQFAEYKVLGIRNSLEKGELEVDTLETSTGKLFKGLQIAWERDADCTDEGEHKKLTVGFPNDAEFVSSIALLQLDPSRLIEAVGAFCEKR